MATLPYFVLSPNTVVSLLGLMRGPDRTVPTPAEDWREAVVDVVIPALNEEKNIPLCLSSLARQTMKPRNIILVDDGSGDRTCEFAREFAASIGMELTVIQRRSPIGKTPTIKRQARELDSDVEFILDGDTVLESENYLARVVEELYQGAGIASACGTILPIREVDRKQVMADPAMAGFLETHPPEAFLHQGGRLSLLRKKITNAYRDVLYRFLQRFIYRGQMTFFGTITNPVGCAVAYRRRYIKELFDHYEPILGDDLTNSEDIFIGFALLDQGYRNIQLMDIVARSTEPEVNRLPRQVYLWSSSFLQSCYYFDDLLRSPFKGLRRLRQRWREKGVEDEGRNRRRIQEAYRQPFGIEHSRKYGRPMGLILLTSAAEKIFFPTAVLIMILLGLWEALVVTLIAETAVAVATLTIISPGRRIRAFFQGLATTPLRYYLLIWDFAIIGRFASDLWISKDRRWRK
jgi:glycosyltransferase involved in cell wall biosynthesis